ncbi:hypothetical protein, partial [Comamonas aquatica]|uniref:hypothetical protein n=1 Tax=Comamonas aquatica TaxID=225991 RepID=UPI0028D586D4
MAVSTSVKWAVSSMVGAPVLNGTAGSLIAVLDAFLVNGFGTKAVDSATVTDGICRMNITGGSAAQDHCVIQLAGVTGDGVALNGPQRVKAATASYVEFACDLPDGPLTGTITFKIAPLGWEKVFSKTNVAVYRSTDPAATRCYLRVDDTGSRNARVVGYEAMAGVDEGIGAFPQQVQISGGGYWPKSEAVSAAARGWTAAGDSRGFVLHTHNTADTGVSGCVWGFGDLDALKSGDTYACALFCAATDITAATSVPSSAIEHVSPSAGTGVFLTRSYTGIGSCVQAVHGVEGLITSTGAAGAVSGALLPTYPHGPGNALMFTRKAVAEPIAGLRGFLRGVHIPAQTCHAVFNRGDFLERVHDLLSSRTRKAKWT